MYGLVRTEIISTLVVAIPKSYRWPMGDEGKQAMKQGGVPGPPPYPKESTKKCFGEKNILLFQQKMLETFSGVHAWL